ncbi:ABC transporter permease [Clostridium sp.]|uniref:ABC transporter permease n=1 Tax=Clostridium sp. TaxID=1506 RepID=UPI002FC5DBCE
MYFKLAINNVRKSFKDYTIYFLTLTFAVCIFYTFNSISAQDSMVTINDSKSESIKKISQIISILSVFVSIILGLLIIYANNFLIKRRKKELGIYMSLGMGENKISRLLVVEELIIGSLSLIAGILLGLFSSQGLSIITAKMFDISLKYYKFLIAPEAMLKTVIYFGIIYILVMALNTIIISKYKLIDLLNAHKKNEEIKIKNYLTAGIIFLVSLTMIGTAYYLINKVGLDFTKIELGISIVLGVIGTAGFFYGLTTFLIIIIKKNKKLYLKKLNIFTLRQINSKINTNFISMTIICLMLFLTISMLSVGVSYKKDNIDSLSPFNATARMIINDNKNESFEKILNKNGFKIQDGDKYEYITEYETKDKLSDVLDEYKKIRDIELNGSSNIKAISISDYNKVRELKGEEKVELNSDSVLVQSNLPFMKQTLDDFIRNKDTISLDGKEYKIQNKKVIKDTNITTGVANNMFTVIVSDEVVKSLIPIKYYLDIKYSNKNIQTSEKYYTTFFENYSTNREKNSEFILLDSKIDIKSDTKLMTTIILYTTLYLGVIFLISSAAVLALQQLSEASDSAERYNSLRRIGVPEEMINKSIFTQTLIYFALPLVLAIVHSIVGIYQANKFMLDFGNSNIMKASTMSMIVIIVIYGGYFMATLLGYKNIVKKF